jgi:hypothetical protein
LQNPNRHYLERNVRLEPVQAPDPQVVVNRALMDTRQAWSRGEPAIVETHRVNFAHLDSAVVSQGQNALDSYLTQLTSDPGNLPHFLADREISSLKGRGVSWIKRGNDLVLRNGSHSSRVVNLPGSAREFRVHQNISPPVALVKVPALTTIIVSADGKLTLCPFGR